MREGPRIIPVPLLSVEWFAACDDFVVVHAGGHAFTLSVTMNSLERRLDPQVFVRVHRSSIVNMAHVTSWTPYDGSRFQLALRDGTTLVASRQRSRYLRRIGL